MEKLSVRIIPDASRPPEEQKALKKFSNFITDFSQLATQLIHVTDEAKRTMGIGDSRDDTVSRTFSRDVLSIEVEGPSRPQLTVVDLPGMIQNENSSGDKDLVDQLTRKYMSQPRTICLAVITALNDADNQRILTLVREVDPKGNRSLGIITKPDRLPANSGNETAFIELAQNKTKKYFFKLGWHVLKNRKFEESQVSFAERNRLEADFFRESNFSKLREDTFGIDALRRRLGDLLFEHVKRELPSMRTEVEKMISTTGRRLGALGLDRDSPEECRDFLMQLSEEVQRVCRCGLSGDYESDFFKSKEIRDFRPTSTWAIRRLRALVQTKTLPKRFVKRDTRLKSARSLPWMKRRPKTSSQMMSWTSSQRIQKSLSPFRMPLLLPGPKE